MDGTLTDSMFLWDGIGFEYARSCGFEPREDFERVISDMSMNEAAEYIQQEYGLCVTAEEIRNGINRIAEPKYRDLVGPKKDIIPFLDELSRRGIPMAVATATDHHLVEMVLEKLDMLKYFKGVFTCGMVGASKFYPDIYEAALECLGTSKSETFVFEDAVYAAKTVKSSNFPLAAVYDPSVGEQGWQQMLQLGDVVITDYKSCFSLFF